jgi:hypothetical protein
MLVGGGSNLTFIETALEREGLDVAQLKQDGRLMSLNGEHVLARFLVDGMPDQARFNDALGGMIRPLAADDRPVRIWGEMVNHLWQHRRIAAAIQLEDFWNALAGRLRFRLFCTYLIDPFAVSDGCESMMHGIVQTHAECVAAEDYARLETAVEMALEEVLGPSQSGMVRTLVRLKAQATKLPGAQALIFWLQEHMPLIADKIINRGRTIYTGLAPQWRNASAA